MDDLSELDQRNRPPGGFSGKGTGGTVPVVEFLQKNQAFLSEDGIYNALEDYSAKAKEILKEYGTTDHEK